MKVDHVIFSAVGFMLLQGVRQREIAKRLNLSVSTVRRMVASHKAEPGNGQAAWERYSRRAAKLNPTREF